jgi:hypothetical protein
MYNRKILSANSAALGVGGKKSPREGKFERYDAMLFS